LLHAPVEFEQVLSEEFVTGWAS